MKRRAILLLGLWLVAGCARGNAGTPNVDATVSAAVQATAQAATAQAATAQAATAQTATDQAATDQGATDQGASDQGASDQGASTEQPAPQATATEEPVATPTPTAPADYAEMSEEQFQEMVDQAVAEAAASSEASSQAATAAVADETVSSTEVEEIDLLLSEAEEALALSEELLDAYLALYGDLAAAGVAEMAAVADELAALEDDLATLDAALQEIDAALAAGTTLAQDTMAQLEAAALAADARAAQALQQLQLARQAAPDFTSLIQGIVPTEIATNRAEALQSVSLYLDEVRAAVADQAISQAEILSVAQLGANASASVQAFGGRQLQSLVPDIEALTGQLARGQIQQATEALGAIQGLLP